MGALTINRKRVNEFSSLYSLSPSGVINLTNFGSYSNKVDSSISKKRRVSDLDRVGVKEAKVKAHSTVSRLQNYPETVGKLRREVHAPCRSNRVGFLSSLSNGGLKGRVSEGQEKEVLAMGNLFGSLRSVRRDYEAKKNAAFGALRHVKVEEEGVLDRKEEDVLDRNEVLLEDSSEVVIIEDGNEVRSGVSDKRRRFENDGLGLLLESRDLEGKGLDNSAVSDGKVLHSPALLDREAYKKLLSSVEQNYSSKLKNLEFEIKSNEAKLHSVRSLHSAQKQREAKKLADLGKPEEDVLREAFTSLSEEEEGEVKRALLNANRRKVLVTHENSNIQITGEVLQCLRPGAWLNDEVINVYVELLKERERREPKKYLNCHFFSTFFYKKLIGGRTGYDYKAVKRWTTLRKLGYKLSECDKIFVPIHKEVHWCLAVINKKDKSFQYLDSLGGRDSQVLTVLAKYYVDEVKDKCGEDIDVSSWDLEYVDDLPEQQNGYDCGVFMIKYADFYSRGMGLHFSQENMPYFRRRTAKEILRLQAL